MTARWPSHPGCIIHRHQGHPLVPAACSPRWPVRRPPRPSRRECLGLLQGDVTYSIDGESLVLTAQKVTGSGRHRARLPHILRPPRRTKAHGVLQPRDGVATWDLAEQAPLPFSPLGSSRRASTPRALRVMGCHPGRGRCSSPWRRDRPGAATSKHQGHHHRCRSRSRVALVVADRARAGRSLQLRLAGEPGGGATCTGQRRITPTAAPR